MDFMAKHLNVRSIPQTTNMASANTFYFPSPTAFYEFVAAKPRKPEDLPTMQSRHQARAGQRGRDPNEKWAGKTESVISFPLGAAQSNHRVSKTKMSISC